MSAAKQCDPKLIEFCHTDRQREIIQAWIDEGTQRRAADKLGVRPSVVSETATRVGKFAAFRGYSPQHGYNFEVPEGFVAKGVSTYYDSEGKIRSQWVKSSQTQQNVIEVVQKAVQSICQDVPRAKPVKRQSRKVMSDLMSVYPMGDPHFGMYSWAAETGDHFDLTIAEHDLYAAVDYLVERSPPSDRGVLVNLGDFFHAENMQGVTTRSGHVLDMDTRFAHMIDVGFRTLRRCIERMLERHQTVEIVNAPGNHDETMALAMSIMFDNLYENEPRVVVHRNPTMRHYIEHGRCLIGVVHGHQTKDNDLPGIMATEQPEAWGRTRFRYYYRGHHHHDVRTEHNGCIVEQFRTLAAGDAYSVGAGYLSGRDMKCIVLHKDEGEQSRFTCGINVLRQKRSA